MTKVHADPVGPDLKAVLSEDGDSPRSIMNIAVQAVLEASLLSSSRSTQADAVSPACPVKD